MKKILNLLFLVFSILTASEVDIVVYSYDRPLQLYACLESLFKYVSGIGEVHVIYRASDEAFDKGFQDLIEDFENKAIFHKQGKNPHQDFGPLVLKSTFESPNEYITFMVDDIIVKDYFNLRKCSEVLQLTNSYAFFLRLGKNITHCYMLHDLETPVPPCKEVIDDVYQYWFKDGKGDWNYPNSVDMTIYKKVTIKDLFEEMYAEGNLWTTSYEAYWDEKRQKADKGLFFTHSKIINIPMNLVTETALQNRHMNIYTTKEQLSIFEQGLKIDITKFYCINNCAPHSEYTVDFIKR